MFTKTIKDVSERANTVFSSQSLIQIGGFVSKDDIDGFKSGNNPTPVIRRAFRGQMAGFFFNDVRVFELAIEGTQFTKQSLLLLVS